jgi:hypothetical protein
MKKTLVLTAVLSLFALSSCESVKEGVTVSAGVTDSYTKGYVDARVLGYGVQVQGKFVTPNDEILTGGDPAVQYPEPEDVVEVSIEK